MCEVLCRDGSNRGRKVAKDFREQFVVDVHMDRLPSVNIADPLEHERNAGRVEVGIETCRSLERTNIELVEVFERDLGQASFSTSFGVKIGTDSTAASSSAAGALIVAPLQDEDHSLPPQYCDCCGAQSLSGAGHERRIKASGGVAGLPQ
jgi:hypothetical protein